MPCLRARFTRPWSTKVFCHHGCFSDVDKIFYDCTCNECSPVSVSRACSLQGRKQLTRIPSTDIALVQGNVFFAKTVFGCCKRNCFYIRGSMMLPCTGDFVFYKVRKDGAAHSTSKLWMELARSRNRGVNVDGFTPRGSGSSTKILYLSKCGCLLTVPLEGLSGYSFDDFNLELVDNVRYLPPMDERTTLASPILLLGPHGAKFQENLPVTLRVPMCVAVANDDVLYCLTSDTAYFEPTKWKRMKDNNLLVQGSVLQFTVTHFSLFSVVVSKRWPKAEKGISPLVGGILKSSEILGVSVEFLPGCSTSEFVASVELVGADPFYICSDTEVLAAPIVSLGPSGTQFDKEVTVELPLENVGEMCHLYGCQPSLKILFSQTELGEVPQWQLYSTKYQVDLRKSPCTIRFSVSHFTMFKVLWNVMDVALPESIKLAWSPYVPQFSFWVNFVAFMTDGCSQENRQFGLCVLCLKFGQASGSGLLHYPLEVGVSKPRKVHSGRLKLRIKSKLFTASEVGGDCKVVLFHGMDFDAQFICHFTCDKVPETGIFGEVLVSREDDAALQEDPFSFSLIKGSVQKPASSTVNAWASPSIYDWEDQFLKELLGLLSIEDHCQELALCLGYNRSEIDMKFTSLSDPAHEILADFKRRRGTVQEFTAAVYKVAGIFKLIPVEEMQQNRQNRRIELSREPAPGLQPGGISSGYRPLPVEPTRLQSGISVGCKRKIDAIQFTTDVLSESKFDDIASEISRSWKSIGRKLAIPEQELDIIERNFQQCGEKEKAFQMLLMWRERDPDNCLPMRLYEVLHDSGLKFTARKCLGS